jgi:hypothetical protein
LLQKSSVSAGELGTSVSALEQNLKNVLDVSCFFSDPPEAILNALLSMQLATYWNAVLLIDEASICQAL